jgi:hypothetical protein
LISALDGVTPMAAYKARMLLAVMLHKTHKTILWIGVWQLVLDLSAITSAGFIVRLSIMARVCCTDDDVDVASVRKL